MKLIHSFIISLWLIFIVEMILRSNIINSIFFTNFFEGLDNNYSHSLSYENKNQETKFFLFSEALLIFHIRQAKSWAIKVVYEILSN